jgi:hypothetical protein
MMLVLGASVLCALVVACALIFFYGPSGSYPARDTLLDPSVISHINIRDKSAKGKGNLQFVFDRIEFSYFDKRLGKMRRNAIPFEQYEKFYTLVSKDISIAEIPEKIESYFDNTYPTLLTIQMRAKEGTIGANQLFQEVQFIEEDYFRVQLKTSEKNPGWAYYHHPHLYHDIMKLFTVAADQ